MLQPKPVCNRIDDGGHWWTEGVGLIIVRSCCLTVSLLLSLLLVGTDGKEAHQTPPVPDSTLNGSILPKEADKEWKLVCVQWSRFPQAKRPQRAQPLDLLLLSKKWSFLVA